MNTLLEQNYVHPHCYDARGHMPPASPLAPPLVKGSRGSREGHCIRTRRQHSIADDCVRNMSKLQRSGASTNRSIPDQGQGHSSLCLLEVGSRGDVFTLQSRVIVHIFVCHHVFNEESISVCTHLCENDSLCNSRNDLC